MQIKNNSVNLKSNQWMIIKLLLMMGCIYFIGSKLWANHFQLSEINWPPAFIPILAGVTPLVGLNWMLEARRWQLSLSSFEPISFVYALNIIFSGLAMNWILPFSSGDVLVRLSAMNDKYRTTAAMMLNRVLMMILTFFFGGFGAFQFFSRNYTFQWTGLIFLTLGAFMILIFRDRFSKFGIYFKQLGRRLFFQILLFSVIRYLVFTIQFLLLLSLFLPDLPRIVIIAGIGWIFFVRSVFPIIFGGVGVREASAIVFFQPFTENLEMVILPVFILWLLNVVLPSVLGVISIMKLRVA